MNLFIKTLGVVACMVSAVNATALQFKVETSKGKEIGSYATTGMLISEGGVCVIGLPNDVQITSVTLLGEDGEAGTASKLISYDAYTRLAFVQLEKASVKGLAITKVSSAFSKHAVWMTGGKQKCLVVGSVGSHNNMVIPFSFYRLHSKDFKMVDRKFPFVKNEAGKLVGMVHSEVPHTFGAVYAVPGALIQKSLEDIAVFGVPTRAWVGVTLDAKVSLPVVQSVRPTSAAAKAGIKKGDVITAINGVALKNYDATFKAMYMLKARREALFAIVRADQRLEFKFAPKKFPGTATRK